MSWDDFDPTPPDDTADQNLTDKLFVDALNNPAGKKLLGYWKARYLDQPVCTPGAGADHGFHREGQNSLIRDALLRLKRGTEPRQ
jgi:hypothetical protein